jgi:hypothetical protein
MAHIKNKKLPAFNTMAEYGYIPKLANTAPDNVTAVAVHFIILTVFIN